MSKHKVEYRHPQGRLIWLATYREGDRVPVCPYESTIVGDYDVLIDGQIAEMHVISDPPKDAA